jgi:uroporphyrinogen-III synthase
VSLLQNKIFISTRPAGKSTELRELLNIYGAELLEMPMIEVMSVELTENEKDTLADVKQFNWLIFTSSNGITYFFEQLKTITGSTNIGNAKIAVVGKRTAKELTKFENKADYINTGNTADDLANELKLLFGKSFPKVLLTLGNLAGNTLEENLKDVAFLKRLNIYETVLPKQLSNKAFDHILNDTYEMLIFTSSSGVINFWQLMENRINLNSLRAACIGTSTSETLKEKGIEPLVTATSMNSEGIASAIVEYYIKGKNKEQGAKNKDKKFSKL